MRIVQLTKDFSASSQPNEIRKASAKILDKHEGILIETIPLQNTLLVEAMYSCGEKVKFYKKCFTPHFRDGEFTDLPFHIKLLLENFQAAFTLKQFFFPQKILTALELNLVSTRHLLKHLVVNSLARRMEILAPQR